jgi:microcystin-dependent protein
MSEPYVGEIRPVGFNFQPNGWSFCDGSLLPISSNTVLFTLIGTTYGGDGVQTFALPNLLGRVPVGQGGNFIPGQQAGEESVIVNIEEMPAHNHLISANSAQGNQLKAINGYPAVSSNRNVYGVPDGTTTLLADSLSISGSAQPHENRQPLLAINFVISLFGVFPSQN